ARPRRRRSAARARCGALRRPLRVLRQQGGLMLRLAGTLLFFGATLAEARPLTVADAVRRALAAVPKVWTAPARPAERTPDLEAARTAYYPRLDASLQFSRATRNNITGTYFTNPTIPVITGPVPASTEFGGIWNSAGALLFSWEPYDFGRRGAAVAAAR